MGIKGVGIKNMGMKGMEMKGMGPQLRKLLPIAAVMIGFFASSLSSWAQVASSDKAALASSKEFCARFCSIIPSQGWACLTSLKRGEDGFQCEMKHFSCQATCGQCARCYDASSGKDACSAAFYSCVKQRLSEIKQTGDGLIYFRGGDGATQEKAVIIQSAQNNLNGVLSETIWAMAMHPAWRRKDQMLIHANGRFYDEITYKTPSDLQTLWFDITDFFGKARAPSLVPALIVPNKKKTRTIRDYPFYGTPFPPF